MCLVEVDEEVVLAQWLEVEEGLGLVMGEQ